ncbi:photosynthetic complex assembly protein PuhC [Aestuariibius insulae]|uniref:photosynthetic complex assembly protein PuhC n=1 Tax=Aestuariibius insulae TaxID=2058287 RepID=UPI00345E65B7
MSNLESQMRLRDKEMVPRILVFAMFSVMALSLAMVTFATLTDRPKVGVLAGSAIVKDVTILMKGDRNGKVTVFNTDGVEIARSDESRNGFISVMWRMLDRKRMLNDADPDAPVRVALLENGHVSVIDDATDFSVELIGYGKDNVAAFQRLID